jgi:hypothetical protein
MKSEGSWSKGVNGGTLLRASSLVPGIDFETDAKPATFGNLRFLTNGNVDWSEI